MSVFAAMVTPDISLLFFMGWRLVLVIARNVENFLSPPVISYFFIINLSYTAGVVPYLLVSLLKRLQDCRFSNALTAQDLF